jgi:hypothetical protein
MECDLVALLQTKLGVSELKSETPNLDFDQYLRF